MKGLVRRIPQGMAARKAQPLVTLLKDVTATSSTGSVTAPTDCWALIWAWGGGGSGASGSTTARGGGGAPGCFKRVRLSRGQSLSYSVATGGATVTATATGNVGGDTTVTLPSGQVLTAPGGTAGLTGTLAARTTASSWDEMRYGGGGAEAGEYGGAAGTGGVTAGGGGAGGFTDKDVGYPGGAGGAASTNGSAPGGGGGAHQGSGASGAGGAGKVRIVLIRAAV